METSKAERSGPFIAYLPMLKLHAMWRTVPPCEEVEQGAAGGKLPCDTAPDILPGMPALGAIRSTLRKLYEADGKLSGRTAPEWLQSIIGKFDFLVRLVSQIACAVTSQSFNASWEQARHEISTF